MKKFLKTNSDDMSENNEKVEGYQFYPENEDIYFKFKEEKNVDPEDISKVMKPDKSHKSPKNSGEEYDDDLFGSNLDVPGSELDDEQENIGNEDEENNYYSIGGDDHNNLDEDLNDL
jgi:hypothetical protein